MVTVDKAGNSLVETLDEGGVHLLRTRGKDRGVVHAHSTMDLDLDGDGITDVKAVDVDGDGIIDHYLIDSNNNGTIDFNDEEVRLCSHGPGAPLCIAFRLAAAARIQTRSTACLAP